MSAPPLPATPPPSPPGTETSEARGDRALKPLPPEEWPNVDHIVTEDDAPVDNLYSEKQRRLLTEPLYSSWDGPGEGRIFLVSADVGLFYAVHQPPLVPDVFLSLDVKPAADLWAKRHRSYFFWEFGKPPEVVIGVVSNTEGEEGGRKLQLYAHMGILYYVIWDPENHLKAGDLRVFVLRDKTYIPLAEPWLPVVSLGLTRWQGTYEDCEAVWLRWCDQNGRVILTGGERADQERQRADQERQRADLQGREREETARRAERLAAQLRALGIEPEA